MKVVKKTLVRIVIESGHRWITPKGEKKPFDCNYKGAIKKGYGMTKKQANKVVEELSRRVVRDKITAIVVFYTDPRLKSEVE